MAGAISEHGKLPIPRTTPQSRDTRLICRISKTSVDIAHHHEGDTAACPAEPDGVKHVEAAGEAGLVNPQGTPLMVACSSLTRSL